MLVRSITTAVLFSMFWLPIDSHAIHSEPPPSEPQFTIIVDDGDVTELIEAIKQANDETFSEYLVTIEVAGDFKFTTEHEVPSIKNRIRIKGPARFLGTGASETLMNGNDSGLDRLFQIDAEARLDLQALEIVDFSLNHDNLALIVNYGLLELNLVQVKSTYSHGYCIRICTPQMGIIFNSHGAEVTLDQVSFVDSGITNLNRPLWGGILSNFGEAHVLNSQFYFPGPGGEWAHGTSLSNAGSLEVRSSTFWFDGDAGNRYPGAIWTDVYSNADTMVYGTIISGFGDEVCSTSTSLGYNLVDNADCGWSAESDFIGLDAHLAWRTVEANWPFGQSLLQYAAVPAPFSAAIDSVPFDSRNLVDLLDNPRDVFLGETDSEISAISDRGAVELWKTGLSEGGINGLYYNPESDGHYIQIQQTDYLTLVIWNTFDLDGNHAWVYGVGQLVDGRAVLAETYINHDVMILPGANVPDVGAEYWGTLEVEMLSCDRGRFRYESVDPGFGDGEFPITRLAYIKQLGCTD